MDSQIIYGRDTLLPALTNGYNSLSLPAYWRMINFLSDNMASFAIYVAQKGYEVKDPTPLDPLFRLWANPQQSAHSFWRTWHFHARHNGNGYGLIRRPSIGSADIIGLHNLLPEDVQVFRIIAEGDSIFDAQIFYFHGPTKTAYPSADILHATALTYDGILGYSAYTLHHSTFARAGLIDRYMLKLLAKGTSIKSSIEFPQGTDKATVQEVLKTLQEFRAATGDKDTLALWGGGTVKSQGISPADAQILEQDRELTKKFAQITGVDPRFAFEKSEGKYTDNAEAAGEEVVRFTFRTLIEQTEAELTIKLLTPTQIDQGYSIKLKADALLRGDSQAEMALASQGANQGVLYPNEARNRLGLPPDPDPASNQLRNPTHLVQPTTEGGTPNESK